MKNKLKAAGFIFLYAAIYFALQFIYLIAATFISGIVIAIKNPNMNQSTMVDKLTNVLTEQAHTAIIFSAVLAIIIFYFIGLMRKENLIKICNFSLINPLTFLVLIIAGISINMSSGYFLNIIDEIEPLKSSFEQHDELINSLLSGNNYILIFISTAIVAPIIEEILFRGLIFNELKKVTSVTMALIIQGVLFGIYHFQLVQGAYAIVFGILMGLVYVWTKSIWSSIIIHVMINGTSTILSNIPTDSNLITFIDKYDPVFFITSSIFVLVCYLYLYKTKTKETQSS